MDEDPRMPGLEELAYRVARESPRGTLTMPDALREMRLAQPDAPEWLLRHALERQLERGRIAFAGDLCLVADDPAAGDARPSFRAIYLGLARQLAARSTCSRLKVGCVITNETFTEVWGLGYNGSAHGLPNRCRRATPGACGCVHAEANAAIKCGRQGGAAKVAFITHQPCEACAQALVQVTGVRMVYYAEPYRLRDGIEVLDAAGIAYCRVPEADPLRQLIEANCALAAKLTTRDPGRALAREFEPDFKHWAAETARAARSLGDTSLAPSSTEKP